MAVAACGRDAKPDASDYLALGMEQIREDEYDEAIDSLSKAIELEPKDPDAYFFRGISYYLKEESYGAIADFDKALELIPNGTVTDITNADIYAMRGSSYGLKEDYDTAIVDLEKAIELEPTNADLEALAAETYAQRGYSYTKAGDYDRAIADFDKAFELDNAIADNFKAFAAETYALRGYIYAKAGNNRTTADFNRAFVLDPKDGQAKKAPEASAEEIDLFPCGGGIECGLLEVPADYRNPDAGNLKIAVNVRRADSPDERIGYLFVNPGGPGGSGLKLARNSERVFADELLSRFDIVGFDPRGVGVSDPSFACGAPGELLALLGTIDGDIDTPDEIAAGEEAASLCIESMGPVGGLLHSEYVARDMDEIRKGLGAEQISYLGFSYGAALGVWYATIFPGSVRAMVVDGADNPVDKADTQQERMEEAFEETAPFEENLKQALTACDSVDCPIYNGGDPIGYYYRAAEKLHLVNSAAGGVPYAAFLGVVTPLYNEAEWPDLWQGLHELNEEEDPSILLEFVMRQLDNEPTAANFTAHVNCLDGFALKPELDRATRLDDSAIFDAVSKERFPLIEAADFDFPSACPFYDQFAPANLDIPLDGGGAPILVVGNHTDPATSFGESEELVNEVLSNGYLLETSHARHVVYPDNECVNEHVHAVLIDVVYPDKRVFCERED